MTIVNVGTSPDSGTGDTLRQALILINQEFAQYAGQSFLTVKYIGAAATNPTARLDAAALQQGDFYLHTPSTTFRFYNGSAWVEAADLEAVNQVLADCGLARDAAMAAGKLYISTAAAQADGALANGSSYIAPLADGSLQAYRKDSGAASTAIGNPFPSAATLQSIAGRPPGFITGPSAVDPLARVLAVEIYQSVNGAAITLPARLCVRECARDATSGGRFRLRLASFDGVSTYGAILREEGNGVYLAVDGTFTGEKWVQLYTTDASLGVPTNTLAGRARVDFGVGVVFGTYVGTIAYAAGGIYPDKTQNGARFANDVNERVNSSALGTRVTANEAALAALDFHPGKANATAPELAAFARVKGLTLYGADPTKFYSWQSLFWKDVGTRFTASIVRADDSSGTGAVAVCSFSLASGADVWTGLREIALAQVSGSGITAAVVMDFTNTAALTVNTASSSAEMYQRRQINAQFVQPAGERTFIDTRVATAIETQAGYASGAKKPFADEMTNTVIRSIVKDIALYGVADKTRQHIISQFNVEQFPGTPLTRVLIDIKDMVSTAVVARYSYSVAAAPSLVDFLEALPSTVKLDDAVLAGRTGVSAVVRLNKAAITGYGIVQAPSTLAGGGIHQDVQFTDDEVDDYLDRDHAHEVLRVGAGQVNTTLRAAVESLYVSPSSRCNRSHYGWRPRVELVDAADYVATFLDVPEYVEIAGVGVDATRVVKENDNHDAMLEFHFDGKIRDLTIFSDTGNGGAWLGEYCIHSDDFNRKSQGGKTQNKRLRQSFKRLKLIGGANQQTWLFGCGTSSGQKIIFDDVYAEHLRQGGTAPAFGFHNTGPTVSFPTIPTGAKPSLVIMRGCRSPDPVGVYVQALGSGLGAKDSLVLQNCEFNLVKQEVAPGEVVTDKAKDRFEWKITGVHAGPILQQDFDGMLVLATTAGAAVGGDAAPIIFGTVDELGRGDLWIKTGTSKSLGARLGDCSVINKTLTIGAQSHVFNTNLTAASNATIIAAINGSIPLNPVSEADIQYEIYPDTGHSRRMLNSTGATIPKGRFVKRTGTNTIALAGPGDPIYGWVYRDILNGLSGIVVTTRQIATAYIQGATAGTGLWGITTNGQLDFSAAAKIGDVHGGIVTVF